MKMTFGHRWWRKLKKLCNYKINELMKMQLMNETLRYDVLNNETI